MSEPTIDNPVNEWGVWLTVDEGRTWTLDQPSPLFAAVRVGVRQPDGSVIEDNGDGTGTHTVYDSEGNVTATEKVSGLPIPEPPVPTDADRIADLEAVIAALLEVE